MSRSFLIVLVLAAVVGVGLYYINQSLVSIGIGYEPPKLAPRAALADVEVDVPPRHAVVTSPLTVKGKARGTWYFEASFPVRVRDGFGTVIGTGIAQAEGEWMTTEYVPFTAEVTFTPPGTTIGTLVLEKDNPSGEPQFDDSVVIPIAFQ